MPRDDPDGSVSARRRQRPAVVVGSAAPNPLIGTLARDPLAVAAVVATAVMAALYASPLLKDPQLELVTDRGGALLFRLLALTGLAAGLARVRSRPEQRLWAGLAVVMAMWAGALVIHWVVAPPRPTGFDLFVDGLYSLSYLVLLVAVERAPHRRREGVAVLARSYAFTASAVFVLGLVTYFVIVPLLVHRASHAAPGPTMLLFLALDLVLVVRTGQFLGEASSIRWRVLFGGLFLFFVGVLAGDLVEAFHWSGSWTEWGRTVDLVLFLPFAILTVTARARHAPLSEEGEIRELEDDLRLPREQLVLFLVLLPGIHLLGYRFLGFDPLTRIARDNAVLMFLVLLGLLAMSQQRRLRRGARALADESVRAVVALQQQQELVLVLTERQQAQEALEASEEKFAIAFRSSPDALLITTVEDGRLVEVNEGFLQQSGYSREEVIGKTTLEIGLWADPGDPPAFFDALASDGKVRNMEVEVRLRSGEHRIALMSAELIEVDGERCLLTVVRDITDAKQAENELRASEERFTKAFRASPDAVLISEIETGTFIEVNASFERISGYPRREAIGRSSLDLEIWAHPEDRDLFVHGLKTQGQVRNMETEIRRRDQSLFDALISAELIELGGKSCILSVVRDVTEITRTEQALRASESRFARAFQSYPDPATLVSRKNGGIIEVNDAFCEVFEFERAELSGMRALDLGLWDRQAAELVTGLLDHEGAIRDLELDVKTKAGDVRSALVSCVLLEIGDEECVLTVTRDVTERKALERQLLRAQRMDSIGTLAGGIAHDLNNILSPVLMSVQLLQRESLSDQGKRLLEILEINVRRGAEMIRQVLSFARGVEGERIELQPRHLVKELEGIVRDTFPKTIELGFEVDPNLWTVEGDATQLHQVLLNLCLNARDAMERHGRLTVSVANRIVDEELSRVHLDAQPGPYVVFEVADTGSGIHADVRDQIFEPFFTTKAMGRGTGLGLSTAGAIVKGHGGFVSVSSEVGAGSRFGVFIPAARVSEELAEPATSGRLPRGRGELVLVVDDEESVRSVATQTLAAFGYRSEVAVDGVEALSWIADHQGEADVILLDMMMPRLDGPRTVEALRRLDEEVPIIAVSGLTGPKDLQESRIQGFLHKPFTAGELLLALEEAIRGGDATRA